MSKDFGIAHQLGPLYAEQCYHMIPHRNAPTHHCDCVCILRKGHEGRHFCAWESA